MEVMNKDKLKIQPYTEALKDFATDDQILECLIIFEEGRQLEAARLLSAYMSPKWRMPPFQSAKILIAVHEEWQTKTHTK